MSFGYAIGDVIAVLGLIERVAIELRNYKDAPCHFQHLRIELDLIHGTLQYVLHLEPESDEERQTMDKIRAIVVHCSQPLQAMADKMRSKESSLGHFRTTRSLSSIGTRLHWSMVAQSDVDAFRKTIMSEMAAINILLSVQQLTRVKQLASQSRCIGTIQALAVEKHATAIAGHATSILSIASRTQSTIDVLVANTAIQTETYSRQAKALNQNLKAMEANIDDLSRKTGKTSGIIHRNATLMTRHARRLFRLMQDIKAMFALFAACSKEMLEAIGRNTRMLLDVTGQLKRIIRAIEAIPLHLTLDIVRLDDAHGESWALPLQACQTWDSFSDMLRLVVYANKRLGADLIVRNQFSIMVAQNGMELNERVWGRVVKSGLHIEQAMVISRASSSGEDCVDSECSGKVVSQAVQLDQRRKVCTLCGRWTTTQTTTAPLVHLYTEVTRETATNHTRATRKTYPGPKLPPMQLEEEPEAFRKVKLYQASQPIKDMDEALELLDKDTMDPAANAFLGFMHLREGEELANDGLVDTSKQYLEIAVKSDASNFGYWYLLGRACVWSQDYKRAHNALQQAVYLTSPSPSVWITIGRFYFLINQYRDSLDYLAKAIRLNPFLYEPWYNLGVLYDSCKNQHDDAVDCFQRCIELNQQLPEVHARLRAQPIIISTSDNEVLNDHLISTMCDSELRMSQDTAVLEAGGDEIVIHPILDVRISDKDDYGSEYGDDKYGDDEDRDDEDRDDEDSEDNSDSPEPS